MPRISALVVLIGAILITMTVIAPHYSGAQLNPSLQSGFDEALVAINNAEAAGAAANETAPLVALLNKALQLNRESLSLPANQTDQRDALLSSAGNILMNVTNQANDLTTASTQRTSLNKILTYASGIVVAVIGAFAYVLGVEFYQRYRIKRTFQMRIRRK